MSLIGLILILAVVGLVAWAVTTLIPMPQNIKTLIVVVAGIVALFYVLSAFGIMGHTGDVRVPTLK